MAETKGRVSPARWAAFRVLEQVANTDAHADDLLHGPLLRGLSEADTGLAHALVMGTLRWQLALEAELMPLLSRPDQELPSPVATALRLGAYQLRHMDRIPAHAALNESVDLVKIAGMPKAAGMVNAILRKLSTAPRPRKPLVESAAAMAERMAHPEWMVARWVRLYGRTVAEKVCAYDLEQPVRGELFTDRAVEIDDGSRLIAELAASARPEAKRVWDTCAAPGGKTLVLAERLTEAQLLATDVAPKRLERMRARLEAAIPGRVKTLEADATRPPVAEGRFDLVLCDAPCSGTGTLARNPEIKVRLECEDLRRQADRQRKILTAALERLESGGRLVYSTCSLEAEENELVVTAVLDRAKEFRITPVSPLLQGLVDAGRMQRWDEAWVRGHFLRTLPGANFAGDGFFAAVLERVG